MIRQVRPPTACEAPPPAEHDVTGIVVADSGHFVPEEQPDIVARHILEHVERHG